MYGNDPGASTKSGASVVLPAWNEGANLPRVAEALLRAPGVAELVVVDDASTDETASSWRASPLARDPRVVFVQNPVRLGLACSVLQGLRRASRGHVLVRDSDWNHDVADTLPLLEAEGDLVVASRYAGGKAPIARANDLLSVTLNRALGNRISDWTYGYFRVRRDLALRAPVGWIFRGRGEYTLRLYSWLLRQPGLAHREVPTRVQPRGEGRSTTRPIRHGAAYLRALLDRAPRPVEPALLARALARWQRKGAGAAACGHSKLGYRARTALVRAALSGGVPKRVLDVGCGNGAFTRALFPEALLDGLEIDPAFLIAALARGYRHADRADLTQPLPPARSRYDTVLCLEVLQYLDGEAIFRLFRELRARAVPGAQLVCLVPNRAHFLHRGRRALGRTPEDYAHVHDVPFLVAAALEAGWEAPRGWGSAYGSRRVRALKEFHRAPPRAVHVALRFTADLTHAQSAF